MFGAFFLAFAIKVPLFPLHTWLPDAHTEAPTAGSVILAGVMLKLGTYGILRFCLPLFPEAAHRMAQPIAVLAIIGIVYGALVATVQTDLKRLVAYTSVSHLGFVVLGIFAFNTTAIQGAIYQMLNHGISTGALFLGVGMLYDRRHTHEIKEYGGLATPMPVLDVVLPVYLRCRRSRCRRSTASSASSSSLSARSRAITRGLPGPPAAPCSPRSIFCGPISAWRWAK